MSGSDEDAADTGDDDAENAASCMLTLLIDKGERGVFLLPVDTL